MSKAKATKGALLAAECEAQALQAAVTTVSRARRASAPGASYIVIESAGTKTIRLSAGDDSAATAVEIAAEVDGEGSIAVPGGLLAELAPLLTGTLKLSADEEGGLAMDCEGFDSLRIQGLASKEIRSSMAYGVRAAGALKGQRLQLPQAAVGAASQVVVCAAHNRESHGAVLEGVLFSVTGGEMVMAATDGRRLAETRTELHGVSDLDPVVLPAAVVSEMGRLCGKDGTLDMVLVDGGAQVVVQVGRTVIASGVVEGTYPEYEKVMPSGDGDRVLVDRATLREIVAALTVLTEGTVRALRVLGNQTASAESMEVSVSGAEADDSGASLAGAVEGDVDFVINGEFFHDALTAIRSDRVEVVVTGALAPVLVRPVDEAGDVVPGVRHVVMPVRPIAPPSVV